MVFDIATGERRRWSSIFPTVTARRTATSVAAGRPTAGADTTGPLLIVGAGVQGLAHAEAFIHGLGVRGEVWIASRSRAKRSIPSRRKGASAGRPGQVVPDADAAMPHCPLIATAPPARPWC